jgi:hypothetical protein
MRQVIDFLSQNKELQTCNFLSKCNPGEQGIIIPTPLEHAQNLVQSLLVGKCIVLSFGSEIGHVPTHWMTAGVDLFSSFFLRTSG